MAAWRKIVDSVLDGMVDMVRVVDTDSTILLMNKKMKEAVGDMVGQKCYSVLGCESPCDQCISLYAIRDRRTYHKTEILHGRIYSVLSSPIMDEEGNVTAAVEVFRDITEERILREQILQHNRKMMEDLEFAQKIQNSFLPSQMPNAYPFRFHSFYKPCESVSGDIYDVFWLDKEHIGFYLADVSGHGVTAAMLTIFLKEAILHLVKDEGRVLSPAGLLEGLYKRFNQVDLEEHFYITLFYGVLNIRSGKLRFSNAGHSVPPFFQNEEGIFPIEIPGIPICRWLDSGQFQEGELTLKPGNRFLLYTDGLVEEKRCRVEQTIARIREVMENNRSMEKKVILDHIYEMIQRENGKEGFQDDVTMLLIDRVRNA
ncbi:MAG: SpoIIE family protein phosphatase [Clostridia bacterium]|jgi:sigma-B regulation protein RsbU (phosphoserine phosphatase)